MIQQTLIVCSQLHPYMEMSMYIPVQMHPSPLHSVQLLVVSTQPLDDLHVHNDSQYCL